MEKKGLASAKLVKWHQVRKKAIEVNPAFGKIVDNMQPGENLSLYLVRYPYGSTVIENGCFHFPLENGSLVPINDCSLPTELRNQLGYNAGSIPMGIVLQRSVELFIPTEDRIIPFSIMEKGKIFALWGVLNRSKSYLASKIWSMTAGARNLFLLPKFTDSGAYKRLARARNITLPLPRQLTDHSPILAQMAQHVEFADDWHTEILLFPLEWLTEQPTEGWKDFHRFLLQEGWDSSEYWRNKVAYDLSWYLFVKRLAKQGIKVTPRTVDIVKHLIAMSLGALPGFSPAIDDEVAPIKALQQDLQEIYGFKDSFPIILAPRHYSASEARPIYWSLQYPTYFESYTKLISENSTLTDLREIHYLLDHFCDAVLQGKIEEVANDFIRDLIKQTEFDFFHSEADRERIVRLTSEIAKEDPSFLQGLDTVNQEAFASYGPFIRGCVRIRAKK